MAKVKTKGSSYTTVIKQLRKVMEKKGDYLSQDDVFKHLDKKKILVSEEGTTELLEELIMENILQDNIDKGDFDDAEDMLDDVPVFTRGRGGSTQNISLKSFDETHEIDLSNISTKKSVTDSEISNKLTDTDDIVK